MSTIVCMSITGKKKALFTKKSQFIVHLVNDLTIKIHGGQSMALIITLIPAAN